jgi:hypothetical protein
MHADYRQVGVVLKKLDELGLSDNTVVALHADHGWNLGEHGDWQKFTNWETGVRVPLIVRDPFLPQSHGKKNTALVELVDMYLPPANNWTCIFGPSGLTGICHIFWLYSRTDSSALRTGAGTPD